MFPDLDVNNRLFPVKDEPEGVGVAGAHDAEVAAVEGCDDIDLQPLGHRDDAGVDQPQWKIGVGGDQVGGPHPIGVDQIDASLLRRRGPEEEGLHLRTEPALEKPGGLYEHRDRDGELARTPREQLGANVVVVVVLVRRGVEHAGVEDDHTSRAARSA